MTLALRLAEKGRGKTSPNPMVGALVISKGRIVGQAYHHAAGQAHAEALALRQAGPRARGATLYVTLEPCRHLKKRTPPCVPEVIRSGVRRVVVAMVDPNPLVRGKGIADSPEIKYCLQFISERHALAHILENAKTQGKLHLRTIHGDPKVNNIMIDISTGQAISIVDMDTVKPGLVHYDIGDCLRSGCNTLGEETEQWEQVHFNPDLCKAILQGYLSMAREFLTGKDFSYIYDSIRLIAFELGLRFFTDYLEGNVYFKVRHPKHNLVRALVQFKLTESIESQEAAIRNIIRETR